MGTKLVAINASVSTGRIAHVPYLILLSELSVVQRVSRIFRSTSSAKTAARRTDTRTSVTDASTTTGTAGIASCEKMRMARHVCGDNGTNTGCGVASSATG